MVVCRYFLQGTCKFGDRCRYDHQLNENYNNFYNSQHNSILRQPNFGGLQQNNTVAPQVKPVGSVDILKVVAADVEAIDKGGQWLLSCYAPFKDKPAIAGFEDLSFEEVRLGYIEAQQNNTVPQYVQQIQNLMQNAILKFKALQSPNQEVIEMLKAISNMPASPQAGVFANNIFGSNIPTNLGQCNTAAFGQVPVFGNSQPQANIFGQGSSHVSGSGIFGGQTSNAQNQLSTGSSSFTRGNTFSNVGVLPNTNSPLFVANNPHLQTQSSPFQQPASPFQQQQIAPAGQGFPQSSSIFGQQPQPAANIFGSTPTNSPMFSTQNSSNAFSQDNTQQMFSQTNMLGQNNNSLFTQATNSSMSIQSNSGSIFGSSQPTIMAPIANSGPVDERLYSKREALTTDELKWFESDDCDLMTVPDKPPPHDLCFNR